MRILKMIVLMLAAMALLSACGGDDGGDSGSGDGSESSGVSGSPDEAVKEFLLAIAEGDGAKACSYASKKALEQIPEGSTCEETLAAESGEITDEARDRVEQSTYEVTNESDSSATVEVTGPDGDSTSFELVVEDGTWKIES